MMIIEEHLTGFERQLQVMDGLSPASIVAYRRVVVEFGAWLRGNDIPPEAAQVTRPVLEGYFEWLFYKNNQNATRRTKLIALQKFFRYLVLKEVVTSDPTKDIHPPKVKRKFVAMFTQEEIYRLFRTVEIETEKGLRDGAILILGAFGGLRVGEVVGLNMADIVDDGQRISVNITEEFGKQGSSRSVELWAAPSARLRQWYAARLAQGARESDPFIVSFGKGGAAKGGRMSGSMMDEFLKTLAKKAQLRRPTVRTHMLRATHAANLRLIEGYDILAIAQRLGHKHISTTQGYIIDWSRINKRYPSLAAYWKEFPKLWDKKEEGAE